jgi:hypothetical protein
MSGYMREVGRTFRFAKSSAFKQGLSEAKALPYNLLIFEILRKGVYYEA